MVSHTFAIAAHRVYVVLFHTHKKHPQELRPHDLTRLMTGLMGGKPWSWRVVGITPKALKLFAQHGFQRPTGQIERGHLQSRSDTTAQLFNGTRPLDREAFLSYWLRHDRTILMLKEENRAKTDVKAYIRINNPRASIFPGGTLIGWQHRQKEIDYLRELYRSQPGRLKLE